MSEENIIKAPNEKPVEFSKDVAHIEVDLNEKKPRKIPYLKILIYGLIFLIISAVLVYLLILLRRPEEFEKIGKEATTAVETKFKNYPHPLPNTCGEEITLCPDGSLVGKTGIKCEFSVCPDTSEDMTKFWKVTNSTQDFKRIYENLDLRYKFELTKTWDFIGKDYGFVLYSPKYNCKDVVVTSDKSCNGTIIEMLTSITTGKSKVKEWYSSAENHIRLNSDIKWPENYELLEIAGVEAVKVENALNNLSYFFIHENTVYALKMVSASELDFKNSLPYINEIITSFEFF
jgi:hypothetical protein